MGVVAALCWGATDFLVGLNARLFGVQRSVFLGQLLGLILLSTLLLVLGRQIDVLYEVKWQLLLTCLAAALLTVMGAVSLSRAFAQGKTAVVAPLVTSYGMFTTLLAWMGGEHITVIQCLQRQVNADADCRRLSRFTGRGGTALRSLS
jgi:uncharacterized membrane protein